MKLTTVKLGFVLFSVAFAAQASTNDAPNTPISFSPVNVNKALSVPAPSPRGQVASNTTSNTVIVRPNRMEYVPISVKNVNYLQCKNGVINDRTLSEEKPLIFNRGSSGNDAFIKTKARKEQNTQKVLYYTEDLDLYVVCDGEVYSMMLQPKMIEPQRIILDGGKGKQIASNVQKINGMPHEETVIDILDKVHSERGNLPHVFQVTKANLNEPWNRVTEKTSARLREKIKLEGSGMTVYLYQMYSRLGDTLHEMDVVNAQLQAGTFAVRLYNHAPKPDTTFLGYVVTWEAL
ncbi:type-F conjugative transfer system secretin TraK [Vibrio aestuarianus]|uniref:TraK domain-containing protein n=1 Tax=Vibrio aestuarianus TaxID=28171 RepID=UPI00237CA42E|nr:type-F conjugative transfer system secretin TraK [Vibrio aestuarianus]MDE1315500.1 type-F conjugative transfer system secretin TraK [Vibrio aestuarianus]